MGNIPVVVEYTASSGVHGIQVHRQPQLLWLKDGEGNSVIKDKLAEINEVNSASIRINKITFK